MTTALKGGILHNLKCQGINVLLIHTIALKYADPYENFDQRGQPDATRK